MPTPWACGEDQGSTWARNPHVICISHFWISAPVWEPRRSLDFCLHFMNEAQTPQSGQSSHLNSKVCYLCLKLNWSVFPFKLIESCYCHHHVVPASAWSLLVCFLLICIREELGPCWRGKLTWTSPEPPEAVSSAGVRLERWTLCELGGWNYS